jgi:ribosome-associated translation inhibitor RaiA
MNIQLIGDQVHLTPVIKILIEEKIQNPIDRLLPHLAEDAKIASIRIQKDKYDNFIVNFDMNLPGKEHIYAETSHILLDSALIDLSQAVEKQIKRYRDDVSPQSLG